MLIAGVDLAAEPKGTFACVIDWTPSGANLIRLNPGATDDDIVALAREVEKLGIDCALGWPADFIRFIASMESEGHLAKPYSGDLDLRRKLAYRETDREVRRITGRWPLSVSTDRLGMTAIRCVGILSQIAASGIEIDRTGNGKLIEVYPAAALRQWGIHTSGYRESKEVRNQMLSRLQSEAPWINLSEFRETLVESCDAFDALIAALITRAAWKGEVHLPAPAQRELASREGWIAIPNGSLGGLLR